MKKLYGLIALLCVNILTFFLLWQFFYYEALDLKIKIVVIAISLLILIIVDLKSFMVLDKRVKQGLEPNRKKKVLKRIRRKKTITNVLLTILCLILAIGNYFYFFANKAISSITLNMEPNEIETYLIVSKDSPLTNPESKQLINIGFDSDQEVYQSLLERKLYQAYNKEAYVHYQPTYTTKNELANQLLNGELDGLMILKETYETLKIENTEFSNGTRILEAYTIATSNAPLSVDVTNQPFNILILGVDIRSWEGDIHTNTRSDTIMVASFNPKTMQASLISIPRDAYVPLSYNDVNDKLTHSGLYGVGCTIETIEDLLDIHINYYAKFNFKALVGLVDALGGVEVDVKYSFTESNSVDIPNAISVQKGLQILNGEEALAYARHRSTQDDHVRNNSQQEVLQAILKKLASFDTLTKVNDLLGVLNTHMTTNLGREEILGLVTLAPQLPELQMTTQVISGEDYECYVPKYNQELWITELDDSSLDEAKQTIQTIHQGG